MRKSKLRSPIRALHQALFHFMPQGTKTTTWVCTQPAQTDSFRDACNSFPSMYYSASSSSSSSDNCSINEVIEQSSIEQNNEESHSTTSCSSSTDFDSSQPVKGFISSNRFFFSPCSSKSLSTTDSDNSNPSELVVKGFISSKRFFFCPCTTNSIMEEEESDTQSETKSETGYHETEFSESPWLETVEEGEGRQCMVMEKGFCKDSVKMSMASMNPFMDFRVSMEEMVVAHGLKELPSLQELLQCYLRLNDKAVHKIIIFAFADLLVNLVTEEETSENNSSSSSNHKREICLSLDSLPLCLRS